jgi:hypothetical protein
MYNKKEMEMLSKEFLAEHNNELVKDLTEMRNQMNEMYSDYFSNIKPKYNSGVVDILMIDNLTNAEKMILLHLIELKKQGMDMVNIATAAKQINKGRAAYGKIVRVLCDKGYVKPHVRRGFYELNKVY